jgi:RING-variant domain
VFHLTVRAHGIAAMESIQQPSHTPSPTNSQEHGEAAPQDGSPHNASSTPSMTSEDSQTVLLENPSSREKSTNSGADSTPRPSMPTRASTFGSHCWICLNDSTEDDAENPPAWRHPCSCNLTAHETCLLDWVADLENPKNHKRTPPPSKILCPQCKSEIRISRPNSYIVAGVRAIDRTLGRLVLPGLGLTIVGTVYAGLTVHGFCSVLIVCGRQHASRIFAEALRHRGWLSGYGLIPLSLIFSRTSYADFVLPGGTLFLLATQLSDRFEIDMTLWPPLPSTVFACLPAIRTAYNICYEKAFGELNRKWIQEVQPRQNEAAEGQENNVADMANAQEDMIDEAADGGLVVQLDINIGGRGNEEAPPAEDAPQNDGEVPAGAEGDAPAEDGAAGNANQGGMHNMLGQRQDEIVTSGIGETVLGALAFPAVAAGMGGLLSYALPETWMSPANWMNGRPGLLRHRWGRSVVGGCLFIVLKDALVLYCRWKLAQTHRQRRIMDYDKKTKEYTLTSS